MTYQHNVVDILQADLISKINANKVIRGIYYNITDAQSSHPECVPSRVLVYGTSANTVSEDGVRFQLVPDYNVLEIWNEDLLDFSVGAKCIYGSRVWVNVSGNLGSTNGYFPTNLLQLNADWEQVPYEVGDDYKLVQMNCKYDVVNDLIISQQYGGLSIGTLPMYVSMFGFSSTDYCDWEQVNKSIISDVQAVVFLNNSKLQQAIKIYAPFFFNNSFEVIQNVSVLTGKFTSPDLYSLPCVAYNKCKSIRTISNTQSIINIPATVRDYTFVTDDESGYLEHDFTAYPYALGDTLVLGCIANKGVSLVNSTMNSDGNLSDGSISSMQLNFGIEVDHPVYHNPIAEDVNVRAEQFYLTSSNRTTDYNRLLILTADKDITQGKLFIAYKYV